MSPMGGQEEFRGVIRLWSKLLHLRLVKLGFKQCMPDMCLYITKNDYNITIWESTLKICWSQELHLDSSTSFPTAYVS